jgi:hypothetical protein
MNNWLVVKHREVGIAALWKPELDLADPTVDPVTVLNTFANYRAALHWIEDTMGIPTEWKYTWSPAMCAHGPGASQFGLMRDRCFGNLIGIYNRGQIANVLGRYPAAYVEVWCGTRSAASRLMAKRSARIGS